VILKKINKKQFFKFIISGSLNTCFGLLVFAALDITNLETWKLLLLSNLAGIIFNFISYGNIVFKDIAPRTFIKYLITYLIMYFIQLILIKLLEPYIHGRVIAMIVILIPMTIVNYYLLKKFVFKKIKLEK
jgi:putative flippase GtrA